MRLHFSIRDLLWLTLVVALGMGWATSHLVLSRRCEQAIYKEKLENFALQLHLDQVYKLAGVNSGDPPTPPPNPSN